MPTSIHSACEQLASGAVSSRALVEHALERIEDISGEGRLAFTRVYAESARRCAEAIDLLRGAGTRLSSIAGLPISIKDLFDAAGETTTAGSKTLEHAPAALQDSPVVARLRNAGAVLVGRTSLSEFAFTGVGMNSHFGTPANPFDRAHRRIAGGSSSGAAVSVSDGMAVAAIGTDTGGSVRIPAALCGLTGFKPTQRRIPREGVFPLSQTLDSVGVIAATVSCCAQVDRVMAGTSLFQAEDPGKFESIERYKFAVPTNYFVDALDAEIAGTFQRALSKISGAGAKIAEITVPGMDIIGAINARGGISAPEAYAFHRRIGTQFERCDRFVSERILRGKEVSAADYLDMLGARRSVAIGFMEALAGYDAMLCPTVPIVAPEIARLEESPDEFRRVNRLLLRNPSVVNFLDGCALSLPCHRQGEAPVGLMLVGRPMEDEHLLAAGIAVERWLSYARD